MNTSVQQMFQQPLICLMMLLSGVREEIGVNHVALNLRFNKADIDTTLKRLADENLPDFNG
ncbi:hypothetical protein [Okeania sp. SIO2C9]|uniref:hypothetical protein n=1 Tax=Okeania sp. SIO2C9 TaxID=2607791 RepID=UPI0025D19581|nr:hypothetical protein [Okeania sp. SIO2C9]